MSSSGRYFVTQPAIELGIRTEVLTLSVFSSVTGGAEETTRLLVQYVWADMIFLTRNSQLGKLEHFCDEDMQSVLPATGDEVLAYTVYLSLEGRIPDTYLP